MFNPARKQPTSPQNFSIPQSPSSRSLGYKTPIAGGSKTIILVRHAESMHNKAAKESGLADRIPDPMLFDAPISELGRTQALELHEKGKDWKFDAVIVSPLTRAMETCFIAFGEKIRANNIPIYVHPLCTEHLQNACDTGRSIDALQQTFPEYNLNFSAFSSKEDIWFYHPHERKHELSWDNLQEEFRSRPWVEPNAHTAERITKFKEYLRNDVKEHKVLVVCHSTFIRDFFGHAEKLPNCGHAEYKIT